MNTVDGSSVTVGGGAPGPGCGSGAGPGGGTITTSGEPLKIIKTQLIPHSHPASLQQSHSPLPSPTTSTPTPTPIPPSSTSCTAISNNNTTQIAHVHAPIQLKNSTSVTNLYSLNPVTAKISHVKTTTIDAANNGGLTLSGLNQAAIGGAGATGTIVTGGNLSTIGTIKVGNSGAVATSLGGTAIAMNTSQTNTSGATSIRAIGAGGQSTQVRVVMGNIMTPSMIKQLENAGPGRTQITAFPAAPARSVSNTSITVTRTATQATYLPRASVTATQMTGVGVGVPASQRLVTPIRTAPASICATAAGPTVTGITATGNFVRGTAVSRNTSSPATTVISPATSTTWMAANPSGQVQLIRAIPHQARQRIVTTQGINGQPVSASGSVGALSGTVVTSTAPALQTGGINNQLQASNSQQNQGQSTLQTVSSAASQQQQQTYVATVLPPRHQATLVYSSNVATPQPIGQQQQQQQQSFNQTSVGTTGPRFAVTTPLTGGSTVTSGPRQIRPIPFAKSFSAAKLNTTSISIRAPNLNSSLGTGLANTNVINNNLINSPRSTAIAGVTSSANVLPSTNLSAARIIQLQQQPGGTAQQIIGTTGRLAANVMLQPIIVNASGTNKLGIRPPVTMAAKVQPSLTITQLGIGKLPSSAGGGTSTLGQQNMSGVNTTTGGNSPSISTGNIGAANLTPNTTTQLVNVSQGGQLLTTQNIVTSSAGGTAAGGATVVPLAISTRGGVGGGNIITSTMTPIKNANAITVGKVITQAQLTASSPMENNNTNSSNNAGGGGPTNVFIHHAPASQRPLSNSSTSSISSGIITSQPGINVSNTGATNVLTSSGNVGAGTFLQPGSTIYYESVPASSVQVSTGVLSLTTTTATSSTMPQNQIASTTTNLSISSLPFATHSGGQSTTATFTVVPSTAGRTIGQLQIPVSNAGSQIQAVPVRFSQLNTANMTTAAADTIAVSQTTPLPQLLQPNSSATIGGGGETSQIIIPTSVTQNATTISTMNTQQTHQMVIPLQTSIKVTSGAGSSNSAVVSNFLRKRDVEGSPIRAAKNLQPTLLSMSSNMVANTSPASSSVGSYSITPVTTCTFNSTSTLTVEALTKKERTNTTYSSTSSSSSNLKNNNNTANVISNRTSRAESPASSDGSTTVSANSSPGVEQQIQDNNMIINRLPGGSGSGSGSGSAVDSHFNPINEHILPGTGTPITSRNLASMEHQNLHQQHHLQGGTPTTSITMQQRLNGSTADCPPRKKSRRSTNDSQLSTQSQTSLILPPPQTNNIISTVTNPPPTTLCHEPETNVVTNGPSVLNSGGGHEVVNGKENTKPVEFIIKRPKNCTLMSAYKQSWKSAYNHFQRYSEIKPREERRPTIMDLANQTNVLGKINGWKIYHLKSQMEDLCENETLGYEKLSSMLKQIESNGITTETERISDLLKGNMQRSKIIVDGVSDAQNQIMKIFEHKSHVSDIINRCASKRNYKKREKV